MKVHLKSVMLFNRKQYTRDDTIRGLENRAFFEPHFAGNRSGKVELNRVIRSFFLPFHPCPTSAIRKGLKQHHTNVRPSFSFFHSLSLFSNWTPHTARINRIQTKYLSPECRWWFAQPCYDDDDDNDVGCVLGQD